MRSKTVSRYLKLLEELETTRTREAEILNLMDLLWQAMSLDEREEIHKVGVDWPPSAQELRKNEENDAD